MHFYFGAPMDSKPPQTRQLCWIKPKRYDFLVSNRQMTGFAQFFDKLVNFGRRCGLSAERSQMTRQRFLSLWTVVDVLLQMYQHSAQ